MLKFFWKWSQKPSGPIFLPEYKNFRLESLETTQKVLKKSSSEKSKSLTKKSEAQALLSSSSSKPLIYNISPSQSGISNSQTAKPAFIRLYKDAVNKETSLERTRKDFIQKEMEECTFRPTVINYSDKSESASVYDRLSYNDFKQREKIYKIIRENKEIEECTFKPKINKSAVATPDTSFEKLYKDAEVQRQKIRNIELLEKDKELNKYTFKPTIINNTASTGNVYEKLYNNFQEIQKERKRKQEENHAKEIAEIQFIPKILHNKREGTNVPVYTRLYAEVERRKDKIKLQDQERQKSKSVPKLQRPNEIPRYEHLYALHKEKQERKLILQEKYLKDAGIVFKPNTLKIDTPKPYRHSSPKSSYPLFKNPYSDTSFQSNIN